MGATESIIKMAKENNGIQSKYGKISVGTTKMVAFFGETVTL